MALSGGFAFVWIGFLAWRSLVGLRRASRAADRHYDKTGKLRLSKEYHDCESASEAARPKCRDKQGP
jgi:hypothetical protein